MQQIANAAVGLDTPPTGTPDNSQLTVSLTQLTAIGSNPAGPGGDGSALPGAANTIFSAGGAAVTAAGQAGTAVGPESESSVAAGFFQPFFQDPLTDYNNVPAATDILNTQAGAAPLAPTVPVPVGDLVGSGVQTDPAPAYTDPLLLDLTGGGINLSNWIASPVYFDTNVLPNAQGAPTTTPDGLLHQTAWMQAGTAMLVFEPGGTVAPITNITQTISQFLNAGPAPAHYADGLAALAALAQPGATVFSAATALTDPVTHVSYWNEVMVWNDANQNGASDAGEVVGLASLGIASISLQGTGNQGLTINGSAVTNVTSYTTTSGTTYEAAAVNLQNDSIGNVATVTAGGVLVNALAEGGPTLATTYVAENAAPHTYFIQNGALIDKTTGTPQTIVASGITSVLSSTQGDTITVSQTDTGTYWLGGGTGADTLWGSNTGTNVFLVNPLTTVHGGNPATSFNIAKVTGTQGVTIDLAHANLNEVIGGPGGSVFNASGTEWNVFTQATSSGHRLPELLVSRGTGRGLRIGPGIVPAIQRLSTRSDSRPERAGRQVQYGV